MPKIEIDNDVMEHLKSKAEPFIDTPNTVLRRELGLNKTKVNKNRIDNSAGEAIDSDKFVKKIIKEYFGYKERPIKVGRYQYLFNLDNKLVYFQNYNNHPKTYLWYRLKSNALKKLKNNNGSEIIFTYPIERVFYTVNVSHLFEKLEQNQWSGNDIEVSIDPEQGYWLQLDWRLNKVQI